MLITREQVTKISLNCSGLQLGSEKERSEEINAQEGVVKREEEQNCSLLCSLWGGRSTSLQEVLVLFTDE